MEAVNEARAWAKTQNQTLKQVLREGPHPMTRIDWATHGPKLLHELERLVPKMKRAALALGSDEEFAEGAVADARAAIAAAKGEDRT